MSGTRNFDSSQRTFVTQSRTVFANSLSQQSAINSGLKTISFGKGGVDNSFSIAADAGGVNVTVAEFNAIVAQETPGPSGPSGPPTLTFTWDGSGGTQLDISAIPVGYTSLAYILCGGGGGGSGLVMNYVSGTGGGSGGYLSGTLAISAGKSISIVFGSGGEGGYGNYSGTPDPTVNGNDGSGTILTYDATSYSAGGGGGATRYPPAGGGGASGNPNGSAGASSGDGGTGGGGGGGGGGGCIGCGPLGSNLVAGNKGTGEHGASDGNDDTFTLSGNGGNGGDGYYRLIFT